MAGAPHTLTSSLLNSSQDLFAPAFPFTPTELRPHASKPCRKQQRQGSSVLPLLEEEQEGVNPPAQGLEHSTPSAPCLSWGCRHQKGEEK